MQPARVLIEPAEVEHRLRQLGLSLETLSDAILIGDAEARGCTPFDPPSAPGMMRWLRTVGALRERQSRDGWTLDDERNFSRTVHPSGSFAIAVATGDGHTGDPDATPSTRYPRGPAARKVVEQNGQLALFTTDELVPERLESVGSGGRVTYFLLVCVDGKVLRAELSRPQAMSEDGRPIAWLERIILPTINRGDGQAAAIAPPEPRPIDVDVERRASN